MMLTKIMINTKSLYWHIDAFIYDYIKGAMLPISELPNLLGYKMIKYNHHDLELMSISTCGFSTITNNIPHVFINEDVIESRMNFTIAHEIGHIYLGHLNNCENSYAANNRIDSVLENQANIFARNILAPINRMLPHMKPEDLMKFFGMSKQASQVRLDTLIDDLDNFKQYVFDNNQIEFDNFLYMPEKQFLNIWRLYHEK